MAKYISYLNPVRFRPVNTTTDDMPRVDKMENQTQYYKGVYPLPYYKANWKLGEEIEIQIQSDDTALISQSIFISTPVGIFSIAGTNITPSGWVGNDVYLYKYTPNVEGDYYYYTREFQSVRWISDVFTATENNLNLVELKYSDTDNRFDGVFYDNGTLIWQPKAYFTGIVTPGKPKSESSIYTDDPNTPVRTRGTTQRTLDVKFTDITTNHYSQLIDILTCDTNYINNQPCIMVDEFDSEETEKSDAVDISTNMIRVEDNNFVKNY